MTCIIGLVSDDAVYLAGDRAGVDGSALHRVSHPKVFTNCDFVIGYTSSFRMGQVLQYAFTPPKPPENCDLMQFMVVKFIPELQAAFDRAGIVRVDSGVKSCGTFLVGFKDRLFEIGDDFQVFESMRGFAAIGSGAPSALGALSVLVDNENRASSILAKAMIAAKEFTTSVADPFDVISTSKF